MYVGVMFGKRFILYSRQSRCVLALSLHGNPWRLVAKATKLTEIICSKSGGTIT